mgnify:FL=1
MLNGVRCLTTKEHRSPISSFVINSLPYYLTIEKARNRLAAIPREIPRSFLAIGMTLVWWGRGSASSEKGRLTSKTSITDVISQRSGEISQDMALHSKGLLPSPGGCRSGVQWARSSL